MERVVPYTNDIMRKCLIEFNKEENKDKLFNWTIGLAFREVWKRFAPYIHAYILLIVSTFVLLLAILGLQVKILTIVSRIV